MQYTSIRKVAQELKSREDAAWSWISEGFIRDLVKAECLPVLKRGNRSLICLNTIEEELPDAIERYRAMQNEETG